MLGEEEGASQFRVGRWSPAVIPGSATAAAIAQPPFAVLLAAGIVLFYGTVLILWMHGDPWLHWVMENIWGVRGVRPSGHWYAPSPLPFFDLEGPLSWRQCHLRGFDVLTHNPCDPLGRLSNYSPLWYLLPIGGPSNTLNLGVLIDGAFLVSLPLLLAPQNWREFWITLLAVVSHSTLFAVERANVDVLMFLQMLGTIWLWRRGYAGGALSTVLAAGFLKFYPIALFALLSNETPRRFVRYAAIAVLAIAIFAIVFHSELARIPTLLPAVVYLEDQFGAIIFPMGASRNLGAPRAAEPFLCLLLIAAACWGAWRLSDRLRTDAPCVPWTEPSVSMLLGAGIVTCACFLLMTNIDYRAIFLLAALPGFFALERLYRQTPIARIFALGCWAVVACLNMEMLRRGALAVGDLHSGDGGDAWHVAPKVIYFLFREATWWFLVILLLAVIATWLRQAPILVSLSRLQGVTWAKNFALRERWIFLTAPAAPLCIFLAIALPMLAARAFLPIAFEWSEGWNAYLATAAIHGKALYPASQSMMFNNYPPLSFFIVGLASLVTGDAIVAGRLISIASLLVLGVGVANTLRALDVRWAPAIFAAVLCMAKLTVFSDFVGLSVPQLLAHAIAIWGFMLLVRQTSDLRTQFAGVLFLSAGFFTKHMLIAQPIALVLWLSAFDRKRAVHVALAGVVLLCVGLASCWLFLNVNLLDVLFAARDYDSARLWHDALIWLSTNAVILLPATAILIIRSDRQAQLAGLYLVTSILTGCYFHGAPGVQANAMFDADIALALCAGLALDWLAALPSAVVSPMALAFCAALFTAPELITISNEWQSKWRPVVTRDYSTELQATNREIALLATVRGPVLCDTISLCYWAGKTEPVDFFNLIQAWHHGRASDRDMANLIARKYYALIQLGYNKDQFSTPAVAASLRSYRVKANMLDGEFLVPIRSR